MIAAVGSLALMVVVPAIPIGRSAGVELHVLDVGQGDAILLRTDAGRWCSSTQALPGMEAMRDGG
jgi:beta-lactamase superfamily II metal-dependent hydrolase